MEMPEGLKTLRWADDIALLKAEFKDEISVKRLNRLGMLVEALKAENEQLRKELDAVTTKLDTVTSERDGLASALIFNNEVLLLSGLTIHHNKKMIDAIELAKKVNEMEMPEITITEAYNLSQLKIAELERIVEALKAENVELLKLLNEAEFNLGIEKTNVRLLKALCDDKHTCVVEQKAKLDGLLDIIDKQHTASLSLCDKLDKAKDVISWYGNLEQYLAELKDMPTGFDFKHTPVHMDGGNRARTTLGELK